VDNDDVDDEIEEGGGGCEYAREYEMMNSNYDIG
jgi:hypothetical protein